MSGSGEIWTGTGWTEEAGSDAVNVNDLGVSGRSREDALWVQFGAAGEPSFEANLYFRASRRRRFRSRVEAFPWPGGTKCVGKGLTSLPVSISNP